MVPIVQWLNGLLNKPVIVDRPNSTRPKRPYLTINLVTPLQKAGSRDNTVANDDGTFSLCGQRTFTLSVKAYSDNGRDNTGFFQAHDLLAQVMDSVDDPELREPLTVAGLAVMSVGDILDLTELVESGFEARAGMDMFMGIAANRDTGLLTIDKVEITATVGGQTDPTFEVPGT